MEVLSSDENEEELMKVVVKGRIKDFIKKMHTVKYQQGRNGRKDGFGL
jgi:hypothetical protein